jgi:hypothetical protein
MEHGLEGLTQPVMMSGAFSNLYQALSSRISSNECLNQCIEHLSVEQP